MGKLATIIAVRDEDMSFVPEGFTPVGVLGGVLTWPDAWAGPRPQLENDPSFRQLIPYIIVHQAGKILTYIRESAGNEGRLHGKASFGIGGHVDAEDFVLDEEGRISIVKTLMLSARREIMEEIGVDVCDVGELRTIGLIKANATDVDKVHLGVAMLLDISAHIDFAFEDTIGNAKFLTPADIRSSELELETWSKLALDFV